MNDTKKILLVEDEATLRTIIAESLSMRGYAVSETAQGDEALARLENENFAIAVIDVMLPVMDGFTIVKQLRKKGILLPVLFLTSKTSPSHVVEGFESGGNDYLKKPFAMEELVIRIQALLSPGRILDTPKSAIVEIGQYKFDSVKQQLRFHNKMISLTARENEVLELLVQNKHTVVQKKMILTAIWGDDNFFNARTLDVFITKLRKYLIDDPHIQIINIRGVGYKLVW